MLDTYIGFNIILTNSIIITELMNDTICIMHKYNIITTKSQTSIMNDRDSIFYLNVVKFC